MSTSITVGMRSHTRYRRREQRGALLEALSKQNGKWVEVATVPGVTQPGLVAYDLLALDLVETYREGNKRRGKLFARITMRGRHALTHDRLESKNFHTSLGLPIEVCEVLGEIAKELGIVYKSNNLNINGKPIISELLRTIALRRGAFVRWYRDYVPNE